MRFKKSPQFVICYGFSTIFAHVRVPVLKMQERGKRYVSVESLSPHRVKVSNVLTHIMGPFDSTFYNALFNFTRFDD